MNTFKIPMNPFNDDKNLYKKGSVTLKDGITVLVGTNGCGKTTFLQLLKGNLRENDIPVLSFDNLKDGGVQHNFDKFMFEGEYDYAAESIAASEGENILISLNMFAKKMGSFIKNGYESKIAHALKKVSEKSEEDKNIPNERWILVDAADSGFSIDNVIELKEFFRTVVDDGKKNGIQINIVVSANEYEMAYNEQCLDVRNMRYRTFKSYETFKKFILNSRKEKDTRFH